MTGSSRRSLVIVFGDMPEALRKSALLIFLSTSSFHIRLYEIAIGFLSFWVTEEELTKKIYHNQAAYTRYFRILLRILVRLQVIRHKFYGNVQLQI